MASCPVLIGRAAERAALEGYLERLRNGVGHTVAIAGEPGIGKSRLATTVGARAREQGVRCLQGQCFEQDRSVPYAPLLDLVQVLLDSQPAEAVVNELRLAPPELVNLLPHLSDPPAQVGLDPAQQKLRLFRTLVQWFADLAAARPLLVTIEDLHWSDDNSLEFLARLARLTAAAPIMLLVTFRDDEPRPALAALLVELRRDRLLVELPLDPLAEAEIHAMVRAILPADRPVRTDVLKHIASWAEGNPFYVEEVLGSLPAIPRTIHDLVRHRAAQLSPAARDVLALAAVAGRRFEFGVLQALTSHAESKLVSLIKELVAAQLVVEQSAERFAFRHALTRAAILAQLLARERKVLHARIADCLEHLDGSEEDLAYHYFEAAVWPKAFAYAERAAERARLLHAPQAAIEQLTRALVAGQELGQVALGHLYSARGAAHETVGAYDRARSDHEQALQLALASGDRHAECQARLGLGFVWSAQDYERAGAEFRAALVLARQIDDPVLLARSLNRFANWQVNVGQPLEALAGHEEALAIFEHAQDQRGMAETLDLLGLAAVHTGDAVRGAAYYQRAAEQFRVLDDRRGLASSLAMLSQLGAMASLRTEIGPAYGLATSIGYGEEAFALAQEIGWRAGEAFALAGLTMALGQSGAYARALDTGRTCLAIAEEVEHQQWIAMAQLVVGGVYLDLQALPLAQHYFERCRAAAEETGSVIFGQQAIALLGLTQLLQGQLTLAEKTLRPALGERGPAEAGASRWIWLIWGRLVLARRERTAALEIADQLSAISGAVIPEVWLLRGQALTHLDRLQEAETVLRAVLQIAEARGVPMLGVRTLIALSKVLRRQRRSVEADQLGARAHAVVEDLAIQLPDGPEQTSFREAMTAVLPPVRRPTALRAAKQRYAGLTARERQVALLVAQGKSNPEIATALVVGQRTAQTHVANILKKLGCTSRAQVGTWVGERRLLDSPR